MGNYHLDRKGKRQRQNCCLWGPYNGSARWSPCHYDPPFPILTIPASTHVGVRHWGWHHSSCHYCIAPLPSANATMSWQSLRDCHIPQTSRYCVQSDHSIALVYVVHWRIPLSHRIKADASKQVGIASCGCSFTPLSSEAYSHIAWSIKMSHASYFSKRIALNYEKFPVPFLVQLILIILWGSTQVSVTPASHLGTQPSPSWGVCFLWTPPTHNIFIVSLVDHHSTRW